MSEQAVKTPEKEAVTSPEPAAVHEASAVMPQGGVKVTSVLSRDEIRQLNRKSDLAGWFSLIVNYTIIAGCFALVAWRTNPATVVVAMLLLGGRQSDSQY